MSHVRKFERGAPFENLDELALWCRDGGYVFWRTDRPIHGSVFLNMLQLGHAARAVGRGQICPGVERLEWRREQIRRAMRRGELAR